MGIKEISIPKRAVSVSGDQTLTVRGISFAMLLALADGHLDDLTRVFQLYFAQQSEKSQEILGQEAVLRLLQVAPRLMAGLVLAGLGEDPRDDDLIAHAASLSFVDAAQLVAAVLELTFVSEESLKKFVSLVLTTARGVATLKEGQQASASGSTVSEAS